MRASAHSSSLWSAKPCSDVAGESSFRIKTCLPFLVESQNSDGGWGYVLGNRSAIEPTCWALVALAGVENPEACKGAIRRGTDWLLLMRLRDGSWPAHPNQNEGCWVTSIACLALHGHSAAPKEVSHGVAWLCGNWPKGGGLLWRMRRRLSVFSQVVHQNDSLRGWSWTHGTSSWVEPTAHVLILLHSLSLETLPARAAKRRKIAEAMLYDRMCPSGGWNSGNPFVYGVAGKPLVGPTAWALLALQEHANRGENRRSLDWLEHACEHVQGPGSLALAQICLASYGRPIRRVSSVLESLWGRNQFSQNIAVMAWTIMALGPVRRWSRWNHGRAGES